MQVLILKEVLDKNTYLEIKRTYRAGSGADVGVKAFLTKGDSEIGHADIGVDGKKNAKLLDIFVKSSFRHRGIGSKMLRLLIDFIKEGIASEIQGDITNADDLPKAIDLFKKHGFSIEECTLYEGKHTVINLTLAQPKFSEFDNLHDVTRVVPKRKY